MYVFANILRLFLRYSKADGENSCSFQGKAQLQSIYFWYIWFLVWYHLLSRSILLRKLILLHFWVDFDVSFRKILGVKFSRP